MASKHLRCAIYTRKSTEHGLELEFNSLDAQREACAAYIKSQASQGWQCLPQHYDDAAFSGGNLERPALKQLLRDIDAGKIDVVVVYKIDRLTRSLADFAKLVEAFDAKSVSFVAVTQQFNTTSSMGRLTLNVLLSFAQFERELSSERVRDKIAASRAKGKWTGGTVPLGYDVRDKKLIPHPTETPTVKYIFSRYLDLKSIQKLIDDLDSRGIVTKRRNTKVKKYNGGIPFTHGSLANLLKNRIYVGEIGHTGKWFAGEHKAIIDRKLFNQVQSQLKSNAVVRIKLRSETGALLAGKLFDDAGNIMSPSYSTKRGVRYRFYVSAALLRGRKSQVGTVGRLAAKPAEEAVTVYMRQLYETLLPRDETFYHFFSHTLTRAVVYKDRLRLSLQGRDEAVELSWRPPQPQRSQAVTEIEEQQHSNSQILNMLVRAHVWVWQLTEGTYETVEALAAEVRLNPKIVRHAIKLAFLEPTITRKVIEGATPVALHARTIDEFCSLRWG